MNEAHIFIKNCYFYMNTKATTNQDAFKDFIKKCESVGINVTDNFGSATCYLSDEDGEFTVEENVEP